MQSLTFQKKFGKMYYRPHILPLEFFSSRWLLFPLICVLSPRGQGRTWWVPHSGQPKKHNFCRNPKTNRNYRKSSNKQKELNSRNGLFLLGWSKQKGVFSAKMTPYLPEKKPFCSYGISADIAETLFAFSSPNFGRKPK